MAALPSVLMVFTGGTISMKIVPGRGAVPARGGQELLDSVPQIGAFARITCEDFDRLPGPHWTPERMLELARHLDARLANDAFDGAVVTHGTDTLEETAYLLDLVLASDKPVVLTGAMKTVDDAIWDGPGNLIASVRAVAGLRGRGVGVAAMMGETLHAARQVAKSHTESFAAFSSSHGGPLGELETDGLHLYASPTRHERYDVPSLECRVALVTAYAGADGALVRHAVADGAVGLIVEALGRGNVPPPMFAAVREAIAAGVCVVVASRCGHGRTAPTYGYEGGGVTLKDAGAIFAGDLPAPKARIKLMVLLGAGYGTDAIRDSFERLGW
jgi:L-asparaginase